MNVHAPIPLRPNYAEAERIERRSWHRAITASVLATGQHSNPARVLKSSWPSDARAQTILKAAVEQTGTGDFPPLDAVTAFRSLAPGSAAVQLFALSPNQLNMQGISTVKVPNVAGLPVVPIFIAEGRPAPNLMFTMAATAVGPVRKVLLMSAVSGELEAAVPETASRVIGAVLSDAANASIDTIAFDALPADDVRPPGLLFNVAPITPSAATDQLIAMSEDLANLVAAIGASGVDPSNAVFVAGPREAMILKLRAGAGFDHEVLMTLGLPAKSIAAFAPNALYVGYDGQPVIETSKESVIHFESDTPLDISTPGTPATVAAPAKSMFQSNLLSVKVRALAAWNVVPGGAAVINNVTW
ncbi:hypothetical protein [Bradyrhizobium canariense]|uniref:hypothetical protein n=1 Tax=Bradyrhizobium canariense TaxID=255045 RepID=UPI000A18CE79|nr:hypothetical protein [Bradyrhizobium canariense]OSI21189.1 hypothetical protein BST65_32045 [Bradyrhizobium canariense]OSI28957.1 hypothetical protein BST66_27895 [Bradyrhizobium canariense]OSI40043.1 hypothetical protein BSZ20_27350 [Bradyrhizobium canariense]OSI45053.1 hypothetical protein BST67_30300 [Bradyrhizobium canariense]OSI50381.1 hypothetical protein BSZ15_32700 [Bradyrhizobium canariense]